MARNNIVSTREVSNNNVANKSRKVINNALDSLIDMGLITEVEGQSDEDNAYALTPEGAVFGHFLWNQTFQGGMSTIGGILTALENYDEDNVNESRQYRTARTKRRFGG